MAYELRMVNADTYNVVVTVSDENGAVVDLTGGGWSFSFESDTINKDSIADPNDFAIETGIYTKGQVAIAISCLETANQGTCRKHFSVVAFKPQTPPLRKTVADGTLYFVNEA